MIRLWLRLMNMCSDRITSRIFKYNCSKAIKCKLKNWEWSVMEIFHSCEQSYLVDIGQCNQKFVLNDCMENLKVQDSQGWFSALWNDEGHLNGNKQRTYRLFKATLSTEKYISLHVPLYKKKIFSMLRCGSLPLEIEKGRHKKPQPIPVNERICNMCILHEIEDEKHFVMNCTLLNDLRNMLFQHCIQNEPSFNNMNNDENFHHIMQNGDYFTLNMIFKMYMLRTLLL